MDEDEHALVLMGEMKKMAFDLGKILL